MHEDGPQHEHKANGHAQISNGGDEIVRKEGETHRGFVEQEEGKDEFGIPAHAPKRRQYVEEDKDEDDFQDAKAEQNGIASDETAAEPSSPAKPAEPLSLQTTQTVDRAPEPSIRNPVPISPTSPKSPNAARKEPYSPTYTHASKNSVALPFSEHSHQQLAPHEEVVEKKEDEGEWQEMPALATHRVYDDWGKVLAKGFDEVEDEGSAYAGLGGAGKGYTRVTADDDVASQGSFEDDTAYLFKEGYARNALDEEDESRDILSQMQTTKTLLTEGQRIAYVGLVRLTMIRMSEKLEAIERTKGSKKAVEFAIEAMKMWSQKMMIRVYSHMEIDTQEQVMVEQLSDHGVLPEDLTPALMQNARVKNPKASQPSSEEASTSQTSLHPPSQSPHPDVEAEKSSSPQPSPDLGTPGSEIPPPAYEDRGVDGLHIERPEDLPDTKNIDLDIRWTVLCDLFLLLITDGIYDARSRTLLELVGKALGIDWNEICRFEKRVTDALEMQEEKEKETWNEEEHLEARRKAAQKKRMIVMGLCTVGGGLVIGLSAGALAPVIGAGLAAGFTSIGVAGTSTFFASTGAAALIGASSGIAGARIGSNASNDRTKAVKTFEYRPLHNNKRVNLIVTVSGWTTGGVDDVRLPFSTLDPVTGDCLSVFWEPEVLQSTGQTLNVLGSEITTQVLQHVLGYTALSTLMAGLSLPIVLSKLSYICSNPWTNSLARADAAGLILADSLVSRNLGMRPVTLIGFSLGARLIFSCIRELARRGALGIVQNVILFGAPIVIKKDEWLRARTVVSGRFVNGYATSDFVLGFLFRITGGGIMPISGLREVLGAGVENVNVTEHVPGHMVYRGMMPVLLREIGFEVTSDEFDEIEDPDPENHKRRQRELITEIEEARRQLEEKPEKKGFLSRFSRKRALQKKDWETYDEKAWRIDPNKDPEKAANDNANVLFDVEAIRREALELAKQGAPIDEITSHMQIREIESTLPPMKINSATLSPPLNSASTTIGASGSATSSLRPSFEVSPSLPPSPVPEQKVNGYDPSDSPRPSDSRPALRSSASLPATATLAVSAITSTNSLPGSGANTSGSKHTARVDADDDEFGKEEEVEMSFE